MTETAYATTADVAARYSGTFDTELVGTLLEDAAVMIDAVNANASAAAKKIVSCRMVIRCIGATDPGIPIGANQATMSALGYSQTWSMSGGSTGELYITKTERKLLGAGDSIGSHSPLEDMCGGDAE